MKKYLVILLLLAVSVSAQNVSEDAGITPDSFLWGIDVALDNLAVTFNPANGIAVANERLAEMQIMADRGNDEALIKANVERVKFLERAFNSIGMDRVEEVLGKHELVLQDLVDRVPEQAQAGLQKSIESSQKARQTVAFNMNSNGG